MNCPKCGSENVSIERRVDGMKTCLDCGYKWRNVAQAGHVVGSCLMKNHQEKQVIENLLRGDLLRKALHYLEADLLGRLYSEIQGAHGNELLHKALEKECSDIETLIEEIRRTL
jgi:hypothetical protein